MKKLFDFFAVLIFSLIALPAFVMISCTNISEDAYFYDSNISIIPSFAKNVTINVSSKSGLVTFLSNKSNFEGDSSRTISPEAYLASDLNFYLGGENKIDNTPLVVQKVDFEPSNGSATVGTITVPINNYNYNFELLAIPASVSVTLGDTVYITSLEQYAVLSGVATADLRYNDGSATVNFYLSSDALSATGSVNLSLYLKDWSAASLNSYDSLKERNVINSVLVGLYEVPVAGEPIVYAGTALSATTPFVFQRSGITSGTYELLITFERNGKQYYFSDSIFILPNQETAATIGIPDILTNEPVAPSNFTQGYIVPPNDDSGYYQLMFTWDDNSNTESNFEIELYDATGQTLITPEIVNNASAWIGSREKTVSFNTDFYGMTTSTGGVSWYAGTLSRNSTYAIFYAQLGKCYLARLRSVNSIGGSDWVYAVSGATTATLAAGTATADSTGLASATTLSATAFSTNVINLYRLKYSLNGGAFGNLSEEGYFNALAGIKTVYYFERVTGGVPIMIPDGTSTAADYNNGIAVLLRGGSGNLEWDYWALGSITGSVFTDTNYDGYTNLTLYAVYEEEPEPSPSSIDYTISENLVFTATLTSAGGITTDSDLDLITITRENSNATTTLNLHYNYTSNTFSYDSVRVTLYFGSEIGTYESLNESLNISFTGLPTGTYNAVVTASKNNVETSKFITIKLRNE